MRLAHKVQEKGDKKRMHTTTNNPVISSRVERGSFAHDYFDSQEYFDHHLGERYIRHNINVYNKLVFKGMSFDAMYQTGCSFRYGDYTLPCNTLELSVDDRTDRTLVEISRLTSADLNNEDSVENIVKFLDCPSVENKDDIVELMVALEDNLRESRDYLDMLDIDLVINNIFTGTIDEEGA